MSTEPRYYVDWTRNMRAVMADNDTHPDQPAVDWSKTGEEAFSWKPVDPDRYMPTADLMSWLEGQTGTYEEMSKIAVRANARQDKMGNRSFTFFPAILEAVAA